MCESPVNTVRNLAIDIYEALQPNAPLSAIEKRVWMLKCRNLPENAIFSILREEYAPDSTLTQPPTTGGAAIIVESLPEQYQRTDWR